MQFDPRVSLSLASAPLICGGKPIPLGELAPKSYDRVYDNEAFEYVWAAISGCISNHRKLSEGFVKIVMCVLCSV